MSEGQKMESSPEERSIGRREWLVGSVIAFAATMSPAFTAQPAAAAGRADWTSVLEAMFPHPALDRSRYAVPANALIAAGEKDPATRQLLADGWNALNDATGGSWAGASATARTSALQGIEGSPLFALLRQTMVFTFYSSPEVWSAFGYEGDAWRFGGYLGKGVNTISWLPDPPAPAPIPE
jgi:hypothetical protein